MRERDGDPISFGRLLHILQGMLGRELDVCAYLNAAELTTGFRGRLELVVSVPLHPAGEGIALSFEHQGSLTLSPCGMQFWEGTTTSPDGCNLRWVEISVGSNAMVHLDERPGVPAENGAGR